MRRSGIIHVQNPRAKQRKWHGNKNKLLPIAQSNRFSSLSDLEIEPDITYKSSANGTSCIANA